MLPGVPMQMNENVTNDSDNNRGYATKNVKKRKKMLKNVKKCNNNNNNHPDNTKKQKD